MIEKNSLCHYSAHSKMSYSGYLCDGAGNILDNTPHFPGNPEIPLLGYDLSDVG
jgi:hypothetical protein